MTIKSEVLDALLAAGATAEMIVAAVKADNANEERRAEAKRDKDAARQRKSRSNRRGHRVSRDVTVTECDPPIEEIIPPVSSDEETKPPRKKQVMAAKPDDVSDRTWGDWLEYRKRKRAPLTESAMDGIRAEAEKAGWPIEQALGKAMARGWQGFEADWVKNEPARPPDPGGSALTARILARQAAAPA